MPERSDIRNIAIIAHVDHGKTTLVDALLWQSGAFSSHLDRDHTQERVMDTGDLEREKGITILAKNTAVDHHVLDPEEGQPDRVTINVVDTPGHADFGGEVERSLSMVDGAVLLVDASEGPLPQTRFVLRKALSAGLPLVLVVNKVDRPDARIEEVVEESMSLLLSLAEDLEAQGHEVDVEGLLDTPIIYASAKAGLSSEQRPKDGHLPTDDLEPLFKTILGYIPGPTFEEDAPLQAQVTNLDASPFLGRLALVRIHNGTLHKGEPVAWVQADGTTKTVRLTEMLRTEGMDRVPVVQAGPGDIVAVAGVDEITIGDSLTDVEDPRPLPPISVDEPAISMTIGTNTSPLAGESRKNKLTARAIKERLDRELVGNVSMRILPTERPDAWEVQARGELALAILVEEMRREGFELTVGKPRVVTQERDGAICEPVERLTVDIPEDYMGAVTQLLAGVKGQMVSLANQDSGWVRMEFTVPARGLIGFRNRFLTDTHGTGIYSAVFDGYEPWFGPIKGRTTGSMVADRAGSATSHAMLQLQERGSMLVKPGDSVYMGQVVAENSRSGDMDVNVTREKKQTNMRAAASDSYEGLNVPRTLSLEEALEFAGVDECVEVTPESVRVRKVELDPKERSKSSYRRKWESSK